MSGKAEVDLFWAEEINGQVGTPMRTKQKVRSKKREYLGWGSIQLISFLESIDKDTSKPISQHDVTSIINEYIVGNNLLNPLRKKRINCDERLHLLFGRKSISRLKIHDLLESHFAENNEESSNESLFNSEDDENIISTIEYQKTTTLERKNQPKKKVTKKPKSCFAAITPDNIKLVYLKRSLVEELLKDPETFESKVVGSFIRIRCDPNDYLQKNSHQLLQVTGIKNFSGAKDKDGDNVLQASGFFKDISIQKLSDDNFSEEECKDLCQRVKDGLLKRPMIVDLEQKARVLHEDITKHWLARELIGLQNLIDRANEKGWRKELYDYLNRKEKLQTPEEQARLLQEMPSIISEDVEIESPEPDTPDPNVEDDSPELLHTTHKQVSLLTEVHNETRDGFERGTTLNFAECVKRESNSPKSILSGASEVPLSDIDRAAYSNDTVCAENCKDVPVQQQPVQQIDLTQENNHVLERTGGLNEAEASQGALKKPALLPPQVIELSDDEETEESSSANQIDRKSLDCMMWHYMDPKGRVQGPFSINSLKRWNDDHYFPPDFKVWKLGQRPNERVLLVDILRQFFRS